MLREEPIHGWWAYAILLESTVGRVNCLVALIRNAASGQLSPPNSSFNRSAKSAAFVENLCVSGLNARLVIRALGGFHQS